MKGPTPLRLLTRGTLGVLALVTFATTAWAQTAPTITAVTPARQVVTLGQNLTLSVTATGTPTPTYQWKRNGLPISGATNASCTITSAAPVRDNGWYQAVVTNSAGSATSAVVFVNVACATSQVVAWGGDDKGQTDLPAGLTGVVAVSAGFWHGLALKSDGTVVAWGDNDFGETNVPVGLTDVVAIVAANGSSLALKADGTLVSWGALTAPAGLTGVVAIAADYHALALKADGSVVGWGVTNVPNGLSNVVAIAANGGSSLALKSDGTVVAWDSDIYGQADVPTGLTGVTAITNSDRGFALKADGSVAVWGAGLNVGQTRMPDGQAGVAALSARSVGNLALMSDGTVLAWGAPMVPIGQPNIVQPIGLTDVVQIALGDRFALALRDASAGFLPVFATQPANATAIFGQSASFGLTATGAATFTYQWQGWQPGTADTAWTNLSDGASYSGTTTATLTVNATTAALNGWKFRCVVGNGTASATSAAATLTATPAVLTLTPATKEVGSSQVPYALAVTSNTTWTVTPSAAWVTVSKTSGAQEGVIDVTVAANTTGANRTATITVGNQVHTLTQRAAGAALRELWAVGSDSYGQLGDNRLSRRTVPAQIAGGAKAVAAGAGNSWYLKTDGTLWAIGASGSSQSGDGTTTYSGTPVQVMSGVSAVAAGARHSLILKTDGTLWAMGANGYGQLGDGTMTDRSAPVQMATGVTAVAAGEMHSLYVKTDGTLWAMGSNSGGQFGDGTTNSSSTPVQVATGVAAVAAGDFQSLYVKTDGTLWAMGSNIYGQLGAGAIDFMPHSTPVQVASGVAAVATGAYHTVYVKTDGTLWAMGGNGYGQLGDGTTTDRSAPVQVATGVTAVAAGEMHSLYVKTDGTLRAMGSNAYGQLGDGTTTNRSTPVQVASNVAAVAADSSHSLYAKTDGTVWAMGNNNYGQLGYGAANSRITPIQVESNVAAATAGDYHSLYVKTDGTLWAMGLNTNSQLGDGTTNYWRTTPVPVATGVAAVVAGEFHSLYLKADGTLWAMGLNAYGELGTGMIDFISHSTPVQVASGVAAVAAGYNHSLYVKTDGTLWVMGHNDHGQLGDGTTTDRGTPVQVATGVTAVAAGEMHSLYVKTDGTLWAMGDNSLGEFGDGTTNSSSTPVQVASGVAAVAAGALHSLYVKTDGTLWTTGFDVSSQLGDGISGGLFRNWTVKVASGVAAVAAGADYSFYVKTDGTLWAAGSNSSGQLGDGTTTNRSLFVQVAANVKSIAGGGGHTLFVADGDIRLVVPQFATQPANQTPVAGSSVTLSVTITGTPSVYQWCKNGTWIAGATNASYTITSVQASDAGSYTCIVTNGAGSVTSSAATLTLNTQPTAPAFTSVASASFIVAQSSTFALTASGSPTPTWSATGLPPWASLNATTGLLSGTPPLGADVSSPYAVTITASNGVTPNAVQAFILIVLPPAGLPTITTQPQSQVVNAGQTVTLSVGATGTPPPSAYQWKKGNTNLADGSAISGATTATLTITNAQPADAGDYSVVVTNSFGSVPSQTAALTVNSDVSATTRLVRLSAHGRVGTGGAALLGAFTIEGTQPKSLLIRAVGPTLFWMGVQDFLIDPQLFVYDAGGALVASNDDWGTAANAAQIAAAAVSFALKSGSKDSAVLATFNPGTYTLKVVGANGAAGNAMLEVYEVDANPRLAYLAVRGLPDSNANALDVGFVVSGTGPSQYLVRAIGSSSLFSAGMIGDPALAVYNSADSMVGSNGDWGNATSAPQIVAATQTAGAQPLVGNGTDAALLVTLNSGYYEAFASGTGGSTGIALVEIFAVDGQRAATMAPAIVSPPIPMTANLGQSAFFGVGTVGRPQPTYQWKKNGTTIAGATNSALNISSVQASDAGDYTVVVTNSSGSVTSSAATLTVPSYHSADTNQNGKLSLAELTRVIELYNTRNGSVRTGRYKLQAGTEDGFAQDTTATANQTLTCCHSADSNHDGQISLSEVTRVIDLYNYRSGTSRTGQYHDQAGTEDGYAPGP